MKVNKTNIAKKLREAQFDPNKDNMLGLLCEQSPEFLLRAARLRIDESLLIEDKHERIVAAMRYLAVAMVKLDVPKEDKLIWNFGEGNEKAPSEVQQPRKRDEGSPGPVSES